MNADMTHRGTGGGLGQASGAAPEGVLNVLKAPGYTSHDVVARVRRLLGIRRIGHTGTLDPGAAGVLVLCVGRATRLVELLQAEDKAYRAEMVLGVSTDSQDSFGRPISEDLGMRVPRAQLEAVMARFVGTIKQVPPMASAVRHQGRRLYELARIGVDVERPAREVTIYEMHLVRVEPDADVLTYGARILFDVVCSKGTYVRTLCADIGRALGCGAYMSFLLRTRAGAFGIQQSRTLEELEEDLRQGTVPMVGMDQALAHLPMVRLSAEAARRAAHGQVVVEADRLVDDFRPGGQRVDAPAPPGATVQGPVRLQDPDGRLVAVADPVATAHGRGWHPRIVLN